MGNEQNNEKLMEQLQIKKSEGKIVRSIVTKITLIVVAILLIVTISGFFYVKSALQPVDPDANTSINVEIPLGSGLSTIAKILEENGIIKDAKIFKYYAKFKNQSNFQAGNYSMTQSMTLDEILESLKTGKLYREPVMSITIPEGLTLEQIAKIIDQKTSYTEDEFMNKVTNQEFIQNMMNAYPELFTDEVLNKNIRYTLEGYLFPATYPFYEENVGLEEIISTMIEKTNDVVKEYRELIDQREMSVHKLLTFASLLEEEATAKTDRETIASVFYNRLEINMPLQTDPTVLYALGSHKEQVLYKDLEVKNPYNTYINPGLPPGPISNAGIASIEAALNPTDTDYLYFLADKKGVNHFARTFDEHKENKSKYLDNN